jgi:hypothetical protein
MVKSIASWTEQITRTPNQKALQLSVAQQKSQRSDPWLPAVDSMLFFNLLYFVEIGSAVTEVPDAAVAVQFVEEL